jgi:hypothetical protein
VIEWNGGVVCGLCVAFSPALFVELYVGYVIGDKGMKHLSASLVHVKQLSSLNLASM